MLKCTLRSTKTINGGIGEEKKFFSKKKTLLKKGFFAEIFLFTKYYVIWDPGGRRKRIDAMVASGMGFRSA